MNEQTNELDSMCGISDEKEEIEQENLYGENKEAEIKKPYDPDKVDIISSPMTIGLLLARIENKEIELNPDFQRKAGLWDNTKKSRLIESILIRVPLPVFYFDSRDDDKWIIVDGLQRITTLNEFVLEKTLTLSNLEYLKEFDGFSYVDLPRIMQRRIQECQIQTYCIRKGTPEDITISIFKRINTGGLILNLAEIRNCVFHGTAGDLVKNMANKVSFKEATRFRISSERMADRELTTRFTAFYVLGYNSYDGNMDLFLEKGLAKIKGLAKDDKKLADELAAKLLSVFDRTMICCKELFGDFAFRKKIKDSDKFGPLNKSLFECVSCCIGLLTDQEQNLLIKNKSDFFNDYKKLFDGAFYNAINSATGTVEHVNLRHKEFTNFLETKLRNYQ